MDATRKVGPSHVSEFARLNGFTLDRQPFGKRGSLVAVWKDGKVLDYRKSWRGALNVMKKLLVEKK